MLNKDNSTTFPLEMLGKAIYSYANYENLAEEAAKKGKSMKDSKDLYGLRILASLEVFFKNKSQEEIFALISRMRPEDT